MKNYLAMSTTRRGIAVLILVIGLAVTAAVIITGPRPNRQPSVEREQAVKGIKLEMIALTPTIVGYGEAQPSKTWKAIAQVEGKVKWQSPKLKNGEFFQTGETILMIDDREIRLKINTREADIKKFQSKIAELNNIRLNYENQLAVKKKVLGFNHKELNRQQTLMKAQAVSAQTVETKEVTVLEQQNSIITTESNLRLLPAQIDYQKAELAAAEASLEQAKLQLEYTKIVAPFDCRVMAVASEVQQYMTVGQEMFSVHSIDDMEVPVQFSLDQMALLVPDSQSMKKNQQVRSTKLSPPNLTVKVKVISGLNHFEWNGEFRRISSGVDTTTRMVSMVVVVRDPYGRKKAFPGQPLDKGAFCTVEIGVPKSRNVLAVPRSALHEGRLYVADRESQLDIRPVKVAYTVEDYAVISEGVKAGDTVITSDLTPAIKGMKIRVSPDRDVRSSVPVASVAVVKP